MKGSGPIKVHFDGRIFEKQSHGGISRVFRSLFGELCAEHDLELYLHMKAGIIVDDLPAEVSVEHFLNPMGLRPGRLFNSLNRFLDTARKKRYFKSLGEGIFHSTYYTTCPAPQLKQVLTLHDMIYEDYPEYFEKRVSHERHILEKKQCIEAADAIVCVSEATRNRLNFHYPAAAESKRVVVIHNGCEISHSIVNSTPSEDLQFTAFEPFLLHVGSRFPHKNFNRVLEAVSHPGLADVSLVSVGGGMWSTEESGLINELGIETRVHNCSSLSDDQLRSAYQSSAAVIVPSITEGFGLPLLEAMAFGCPVASSTGGSLPEVGGDIPIYFDPFDVDQMEKAIINALSIDRQDEQIGLGIERAASFSWQKAGAACAKLYRDIS